jgi:heme/copper-type cytochrome/quinol oxidase subunit 2
VIRAWALAAALAAFGAGAQEFTPNRREVSIVAREYAFNPDRIEVVQNDLVRVSLRSEDRAYSFAVDAYRILKRVGAGRTIVFEFRADQAGSFRFHCSLTSDPACREMHGTLVVTAK